MIYKTSQMEKVSSTSLSYFYTFSYLYALKFGVVAI